MFKNIGNQETCGEIPPNVDTFFTIGEKRKIPTDINLNNVQQPDKKRPRGREIQFYIQQRKILAIVAILTSKFRSLIHNNFIESSKSSHLSRNELLESNINFERELMVQYLEISIQLIKKHDENLLTDCEQLHDDVLLKTTNRTGEIHFAKSKALLRKNCNTRAIFIESLIQLSQHSIEKI